MAPLTTFGVLLLVTGTVLATSEPTLTEATSKDNSDGCQCYLVSGPDPGYFQYHRYWDFRGIVSQDGDDFSFPPPLVTTSESSGGQNLTASYFNTDAWNADWSIQNDPEEPNATVPSINSAQNVFISQDQDSDGNNFTFLTLRTSRPSEDFQSIAEIDSNQDNLFHSSIRTRMRIIPLLEDTTSTYGLGALGQPIDGVNASHPVAPGACLGFFTYQSDSQESDIEILTSDPITDIRYSNQPDFNPRTDESVPGASTEAAMPEAKVWTDWHDHRIDWYDGVSRWYVDGELVLEKTINVPTKPSGLILNLWSDGEFWTGNMSVGAQVTAGFQWIEMTYNTSGPISGPTKRKHHDLCSIGCSIDNVNDIGYPIVAFNVTGNGSGTNDANKGFGVVDTVAQVVIFFWAILLMV